MQSLPTNETSTTSTDGIQSLPTNETPTTSIDVMQALPTTDLPSAPADYSAVFPQTRPASRSSCSKMFKKTCGVCSAAARGIHFGGVSCESCKSFFRRSVQTGMWQTFLCHRSSSSPCTLTPTSRSCRACRYSACERAGMTASLVMPEDERKALMQRRIQRRTQQANVFRTSHQDSPHNSNVQTHSHYTHQGTHGSQDWQRDPNGKKCMSQNPQERLDDRNLMLKEPLAIRQSSLGQQSKVNYCQSSLLKQDQYTERYLLERGILKEGQRILRINGTQGNPNHLGSIVRGVGSNISNRPFAVKSVVPILPGRRVVDPKLMEKLIHRQVTTGVKQIRVDNQSDSVRQAEIVNQHILKVKNVKEEDGHLVYEYMDNNKNERWGHGSTQRNYSNSYVSNNTDKVGLDTSVYESIGGRYNNSSWDVSLVRSSDSTPKYGRGEPSWGGVHFTTSKNPCSNKVTSIERYSMSDENIKSFCRTLKSCLTFPKSEPNEYVEKCESKEVSEEAAKLEQLVYLTCKGLGKFYSLMPDLKEFGDEGCHLLKQAVSKGIFLLGAHHFQPAEESWPEVSTNCAATGITLASVLSCMPHLPASDLTSFMRKYCVLFTDEVVVVLGLMVALYDLGVDVEDNLSVSDAMQKSGLHNSKFTDVSVTQSGNSFQERSVNTSNIFRKVEMQSGELSKSTLTREVEEENYHLMKKENEWAEEDVKVKDELEFEEQIANVKDEPEDYKSTTHGQDVDCPLQDVGLDNLKTRSARKREQYMDLLQQYLTQRDPARSPFTVVQEVGACLVEVRQLAHSCFAAQEGSEPSPRVPINPIAEDTLKMETSELESNKYDSEILEYSAIAPKNETPDIDVEFGMNENIENSALLSKQKTEHKSLDFSENESENEYHLYEPFKCEPELATEDKLPIKTNLDIPPESTSFGNCPSSATKHIDITTCTSTLSRSVFTPTHSYSHTKPLPIQAHPTENRFSIVKTEELETSSSSPAGQRNNSEAKQDQEKKSKLTLSSFFSSFSTGSPQIPMEDNDLDEQSFSTNISSEMVENNSRSDPQKMSQLKKTCLMSSAHSPRLASAASRTPMTLVYPNLEFLMPSYINYEDVLPNSKYSSYNSAIITREDVHFGFDKYPGDRDATNREIYSRVDEGFDPENIRSLCQNLKSCLIFPKTEPNECIKKCGNKEQAARVEQLVYLTCKGLGKFYSLTPDLKEFGDEGCHLLKQAVSKGIFLLGAHHFQPAEESWTEVSSTNCAATGITLASVLSCMPHLPASDLTSFMRKYCVLFTDEVVVVLGLMVALYDLGVDVEDNLSVSDAMHKSGLHNSGAADVSATQSGNCVQESVIKTSDFDRNVIVQSGELSKTPLSIDETNCPLTMKEKECEKYNLQVQDDLANVKDEHKDYDSKTEGRDVKRPLQSMRLINVKIRMIRKRDKHMNLLQQYLTQRGSAQSSFTVVQELGACLEEVRQLAGSCFATQEESKLS